MKLPSSPLFSPIRLLQDITEWARKVVLVVNHLHDSVDDIYDNLEGGSYPGRLTKGVDTTDDIVIDSSTAGLVLLDTAGHYWRIKVNTSGVLTTTDLGITKP